MQWWARGGDLNRGDIADVGRESDGEGDLEGVGGGRGIDGERGIGQLVVLSGSVGVGAEVVVWGDEGDISGGRGGTGGDGVGAERRARREQGMVKWGGVSTSYRRRREGVGMMWLERARGEGQMDKMDKGMRGLREIQGERATDKRRGI